MSKLSTRAVKAHRRKSARGYTEREIRSWAPKRVPGATFHVVDQFGERDLVIPDGDLPWIGDPTSGVLDLEAKSGIRLKDGGDPHWLFRLFHQFEQQRDERSEISFREFCARRHADKIDTDVIFDQPACAVIIDGVRYQIDHPTALKMLIEIHAARGRYVARPAGVKLRKYKDNLPDAVLKCLESKTGPGGGTRWKP